ncbi:hypothetical protein BD779DRAFT_1492785 [Infundibulicybe gibba]|nr:hypothetical protein BD779DRAFT_1492785 [Infundibulicybe gibba]
MAGCSSTGATHTSTEEDVYEGYRIPNSSTLLECMVFQPERPTKDGKLDPARLDPNATLRSIYISSVLAVFDVTALFDENGQ